MQVMKVIAKHERDDQLHELDDVQVQELEDETGLDLFWMYQNDVWQFSLRNGWNYQLQASQ